MPSWLQTLLMVVLVLSILIGGLLGILWFADQCMIAYHNAESTMPTDGLVQIWYLDDGKVIFSWPESDDTEGYFVQFLVTEADGSQRVMYSVWQKENYYAFSGAPLPKDMTVRIHSYKHYSYPFQDFYRTRLGEAYVEVTSDFDPPRIEELAWTADPDTDEVTVTFQMDGDTTARLYYVDGDGGMTQIDTLTEGQRTISFGDNGDFPMPDFEGSHTFAFDAYSEDGSSIYYGIVTDSFTVVREDLLGTQLYLECTDEGNNAFTLTWNETKGEHYEIQQYDPDTGEWFTVHRVPRDGERTYYTGHLERYSTFTYRVIALGGQTLEEDPSENPEATPEENPEDVPLDSGFAAYPAEVTVETGASVVYSTIWTIQKLDVYVDPEMTETLGTTKAGDAFCVLDASDSWFYVRFGEVYGYLDNRYCMINLPEFIGDLCLYDITNSYESMYEVHEFEIPEVTGTVITGYEKVELNEGEYLVPLLYPTALKLEQAAFAAAEEGYKIKIYDSFRPRKATLELYDIATALLETPIPDTIYYTEKEFKELRGEDPMTWNEFLGVELPEQPPETEPTQPPAEGEEPVEDGRPTYGELMTDNGRYGLNNFLAKGGSNHNRGIAIDMTMVSIRTGKELEPQTSMHDLSWYSENKENNDDAKTIARIMKANGFGGLTSEWWHFQDNDARDTLDLPWMQNGVTPECWMADDHGWRYRRSNGKYYRDTTATIDGVEYTFDGNGYVVETPTED